MQPEDLDAISADTILRFAKRHLVEGTGDPARGRELLDSIVFLFPDTPSAVEAYRLLAELNDTAGPYEPDRGST